MKRGEGFIDWSTAEIAVTTRPQENTLTVEVSGDLGLQWQKSFDDLARIHNQDQAHRERPWGNVSLAGTGSSMGITEIVVEEVKPGAEKDLKAQLDHFAKQASRSAVPAEEDAARQRAEKQARAQERAKQASEMQERFRAA